MTTEPMMAQDVEVNQSLPSPVVFERSGEVRTTSRDVAELFGKNHRDVLRTMDALIHDAPELSEGGMRSFAQTPYIEPGTGQTYRQYEMTRDGFTLLAMGFTGKKALKFKLAYIEAFNRMETALRSRPAIDLNNPADLRMLLANYANDKMELQGKVASMETTVAAFDQIAVAHGSMPVTDASKHLGVGRAALFGFLRQNKWLYRRAGTNYDLAYQDKIEAGLMEHKVTTDHRPDGTDRIYTQARVTPKGLTRLAKLLQPTARLVTDAA